MTDSDYEVGMDDLHCLVARSETGDAAAIRDLRKLMETHLEAWEIVGSLAKHVERHWLDTVLGDQMIARQAAEVEMQRIRSDVCGPNPTRLETLVADRIAVCWLQMQHVDALCAKSMQLGNHAHDERLQKRQDRAHRRYLSAIKAMAAVQRLRNPAVQVNIAEKQVNINSISREDWPDSP